MSDTVNRQAEQLVAAAVRRQRVDGVNDLATALPLSVVPDLVGWPADRRQHLLRWGGATFDVLVQIDGAETKFLSANSISEFSHSLGHSRHSRHFALRKSNELFCRRTTVKSVTRPADRV